MKITWGRQDTNIFANQELDSLYSILNPRKMTPVPFYQVCHKISSFFLKIFAPPYAQFHIKRDNGMVCKPGPNLQWPKYFFNSLSNEVPDSNLVPTDYRGCRSKCHAF